jgi:hypothetical protein
MKKLNKAFILIFTLLISVSSFAQIEKEKASLSIGGDIAFPLKAKTFYPGFGGTIKGAIALTRKTSFTLTTGYISFKGKTFGDTTVLGESFIPVRAGFQYKPSSNLYIEAQAGYARKNYGSFHSLNGSYTSPPSVNTFNYAINIGYIINKNFEVSARYEDYLLKGKSQLPSIGLRVAYRLKLW